MLVTEINDRKRGERFGLPPTSTSAPSRYRLECRLAAGSRPRNGDERRSLALWAVRQPTSHWGLLLSLLGNRKTRMMALQEIQKVRQNAITSTQYQH